MNTGLGISSAILERQTVSPVPREGNGRVESLDQFRGYTVLGMMLVNFIGGFAAVHSVFKHNDNYFSYADSIMPSFHFAVGYAFRLTMLKRLRQGGVGAAYWSYVRRSFTLIFLAALLFGSGQTFENWAKFSAFPAGWAEQTGAAFATTFFAQWANYFAHFFKSQMWNTFAIIGATQLFVLPFVPARPRVRVAALAACGLIHFLLCYWFDWGFVRGDKTNWMVQLWRTGDDASWDGGFFGPICWAIPMLAGTLAYDVMRQSETGRAAVRRLLLAGGSLMLIAYLLSCVTRGFDVDHGAKRSASDPRAAQDPFAPPSTAFHPRPLGSFFAEPPFVAPPPPEQRLQNYWMMSKQIPTLSFIFFATGFASALYGFFVLCCDVGRLRLGVFRTFGTNPLAAYCLHEVMLFQFARIMPGDAPLWYCLVGVSTFFVCLYLCVRGLERAHLFIRL